jgi:hypothetical protein
MEERDEIRVLEGRNHKGAEVDSAGAGEGTKKRKRNIWE